MAAERCHSRPLLRVPLVVAVVLLLGVCVTSGTVATRGAQLRGTLRSCKQVNTPEDVPPNYDCHTIHETVLNPDNPHQTRQCCVSDINIISGGMGPLPEPDILDDTPKANPNCPLVSVDVKSVGGESAGVGSASIKIHINDKIENPATNGNGFNIVELDKNRRFVKVKSFDVDSDTIAAQEMVNFLSGIPKGHHVIVAVRGSASHGITNAVADALAGCGADKNLVKPNTMLGSYAMIGVKGQSPQQSYEIQQDKKPVGAEVHLTKQLPCFDFDSEGTGATQGDNGSGHGDNNMSSNLDGVPMISP